MPPVCTCGNDVTQSVGQGNGAVNVDFAECYATDNFGSAILTSRSHAPGEQFSIGVTRVVYVFTDLSDNSVECGFDVTVTIDGEKLWAYVPGKGYIYF